MGCGHGDKSLHKKLLPLFPVDCRFGFPGDPMGNVRCTPHTFSIPSVSEAALDFRVEAEHDGVMLSRLWDTVFRTSDSPVETALGEGPTSGPAQ